MDPADSWDAVDKSNRELKQMIDEGALGKLHTIRSSSNDPYDPSGERHDPAKS